MGTFERKEREKQERRQAILRAAKQVFFEKGLVGATMDEIAERAELSKGALYLYFRSKEDLYLSLANEGMDILIQSFKMVAAKNLRGDVLLLRLGKAYYRFYEEFQDYFKILFFLEHGDIHTKVSPELKNEVELKGAQCLELVAQVVNKGIHEGIFRKDIKPGEIAAILWTNSNGIIHFIHNHKCDPDVQKRLGIRCKNLLNQSWLLTLSAMKAH